MEQGRAWPGSHVVRLWFFSIVAVLVLLPLILEGLHALNGQLRGGVWCWQPRKIGGMV